MSFHNILLIIFSFQKALASVFTYTKNGLNTEASFDVKVLPNINYL